MKSLLAVRMPALIILFAVGLAAQMPRPAQVPAELAAPRAEMVVVAAGEDPYLPLAQEIAAQEGAVIAATFAAALAHDPTTVLWVASPALLSDQALVGAGRALRAHPTAVAAGVISGATLDEARALWQRGKAVRGQRVAAVNAEYPEAGVPAGRIIVPGEPAARPLSIAGLQEALQAADYLTFTGHGGRRSWNLDPRTRFTAADIPPLGPIVVGTASCNTFRIWEEESIALAFAGRGAAAYAGFAYSPNEGYLIGEFDGLPFRYTWPGFPAGLVVAAQNRGTLQGFAALPYYWLLGDPRVALQAQPPYGPPQDEVQGEVRTLSYGDAPAGVIPVRVPGGAAYSFVEAVRLGAAWDRDPFYNARLQMVNAGADKVLLVAHRGGDLTLRLHRRPPLYWAPLDILTDALDHTVIHVQRNGGDAVALIAGIVAALGVAWRIARRKAPASALLPCAAGLAPAALQAAYTFGRLGHVTITSKPVAPLPLAWAGTFLLASAGAFIYLNARSRPARETAVWLACFPAAAAALVGLAPIAANLLIFTPRTGAGIYNAALALLALGALIVELALCEAAFALVGLAYRAPTSPQPVGAVPPPR